MDITLNDKIMEFGIKQFIRKYLSEFLLNTPKSELNKDDKSQECYNFIIDKFHNYLDKELLEIGESVKNKEDNNARI